MTDREIFKTNLDNLMRITKVKQIDIAKYAQVSYQTVSAWVCGRGYPRAEQMEKLCQFFGVRQSALTEQKEQEPSKEDILLSVFRAMSDYAQDELIKRASELQKLYPKRGRKNG